MNNQLLNGLRLQLKLAKREREREKSIIVATSNLFSSLYISNIMRIRTDYLMLQLDSAEY